MDDYLWKRVNDKLVSPEGITLAVFKHPNTVGLNDDERREAHKAMATIARKIIDHLNNTETRL